MSQQAEPTADDQVPLPPPCVKCRHYLRTLGMVLMSEPARCLNTGPSKLNYNPVTGKSDAIPIKYHNTCRTERDAEYDDYETRCGYKAKFWVPRNKKDLFLAMKHAGAPSY